MGAFSRSKGSREERMLVQHLRDLGYDSPRRVPLSGASAHFKFDVLAEKNGKTHSFELKSRRELFTWLYKFIASDGFRWAFEGKIVGIDYTPEGAAKAGFDVYFKTPETKEHIRAVKRILALEAYCKGADFLVLRCNSKPRLFLKFWGGNAKS